MTADWRVEITDTASNQIRSIKDRRLQQLVLRRIRELEHDRLEQGKPLVGELQGFYSARAAGQRYRIIYQVLRHEVVVLVVAAGPRREGDKRDIHALARRLVRAGLLGPPDDPQIP